jgi:hypothetical protein
VSQIHGWLIAQTIGKPFGRVGVITTLEQLLQGGATDRIKEQKWWTLSIAGRPSPWRSTADASPEQNAVWGGASPADGTSTDKRTRQWAELGLWYPALSQAAAAAPLQRLATLPLAGVDIEGLPAEGRNIDMTTIGGDEGVSASGNLSHSYLQIKDFHEVWKAYRVVRALFAQ